MMGVKLLYLCLLAVNGRLDVFEAGDKGKDREFLSKILKFLLNTVYSVDEEKVEVPKQSEVVKEMQEDVQECCAEIEMNAFGTHSIFIQSNPEKKVWVNEQNQKIVFNEYFDIWQIEDGRSVMGSGMFKF